MKIRHTIENNITWEQLKAAAEAGTAESLAPLKSEIDLTLEGGEAVTVVVAAHLPATADKPAGIRFVFKDALTEPHRMNDDWTNKGGYMLTPAELYRANGFPTDYIIERDYQGNTYGKTKQVARCGNAVPPPFATALVRANFPEWCDQEITTMAQLERAVAV